MIVFILKSSACLAIFLMFYKLLLENERMHSFKRFYLLAVLVISLAIPFITFFKVVEEMPDSIPSVSVPLENNSTDLSMTGYKATASPMGSETETNYWPVVLWIIYGIGVVLFSLKFLINLWKIAVNVRINPKLKIDKVIYVLLRDAIVPHTFFRYIFLHRATFEVNGIPKDVLIHEATHARQKHSLDILFVEVLQIVFWFNPLFHFAKKTIKLNHEFLADESVLNQGSATSDYQNTLLAFASSASYKNHLPSMANAINYSSYSSIKKRFKIMKTRTSKKSILMRSLLLLPLLAILLYGFTKTKIVTLEKKRTGESGLKLEEGLTNPKSNPNSNTENTSNRSVELAGLILDSETLKPIENVEIYSSNGKILSKTDPRGYYRIQFDELGQGEIKFEFSLHKDGYKTLEQREHWGNLKGKIAFTNYYGLQKKESKTPEFSQYEPSIRNLSYSSVLDNFHLVKTSFEFDKKIDEAKKGNQHILFEIDNTLYLVNNTGLIQINSRDDLISINDDRIVNASEINGSIERKNVTGMTPLDIHSVQYAIYTIPVDHIVTPLQGATQKQLTEYKTLAKKYNTQPKETRVIPSKDLQSLELIYRKMSEEQKAEAEPFPECPDPNTTDQEGATTKQIGEYNKLAKTYNTKLANKGNIRIKKFEVDRLNYLYGLMTENQRTKAEAFPDFPKPPAPAVPPSPPNSPDKSEKEAAEEILAYIISNQDPGDYGYIGTNPVSSRKQFITPKPKNTFYVKKDYSMIRTINEVKSKNEVTQESKSVERPLKTIPYWNIAIDNDAKIYLDGKEILYAEMKRMELEGTITNVNLIKEDKGSFSIVLNDLNLRPNAPPSPTTPKTPLDFIKLMTEKNARFYYKNEEISSKKSIELVKENPNISIDAEGESGSNPVITLSSEPIKIED